MPKEGEDCYDALSSSELVSNLHNVLTDLSRNPCPVVESPPNLKKRASVALVLRVKPQFSHWPPSSSQPTSQGGKLPQPSDDSSAFDTNLNAFFAQDWVQHGDPEVLFIKRASRKGDRWQGQIALPGGGREPGDSDDRDAAIRETSEEVGLDLNADNALYVANLPQRLVTTSWGKVPLMVLCPYIFLLTKHDVPPLRLQPTEIASTHWVPLRALLSPSLRTRVLQDVSSRMAKQEVGITRWFYRAILGKMMFFAIRLVPSESLHSITSIDAAVPHEVNPSGVRRAADTVTSVVAPGARRVESDPLLLWGLTLGVVIDFIELLPASNAPAAMAWTYPTFSPWDVRFAIWALSWRFRRQKRREISLDDLEEERASEPEDGTRSWIQLDDAGATSAADVGWSGLGSGRFYRQAIRRRQTDRASAVGTLLEGYYDIIRTSVTVALLIRVGVATAIGGVVWTRWRRR